MPLIVAIGMSQHWPIIGWSYGKPGLYGAHAVVRAIGAFVIWNWLPDGRFTLLPFWVAGGLSRHRRSDHHGRRREAAARTA